MIGGLSLHAAGRLGLQIPPLARAGRMLVRPRHRGIHADVPGDQPGRIGAPLQGGQDLPPGAVPLSAAEQAVDRLPRSVGRGHVPPRRAGPDPPPDPVNELPFRPFRRAAWLLAARRHHAAGADHVGIQVIADPGETPMPGFRALAWQLRAAAVR